MQLRSIGDVCRKPCVHSDLRDEARTAIVKEQSISHCTSNYLCLEPTSPSLCQRRPNRTTQDLKCRMPQNRISQSWGLAEGRRTRPPETPQELIKTPIADLVQKGPVKMRLVSGERRVSENFPGADLRRKDPTTELLSCVETQTWPSASGLVR